MWKISGGEGTDKDIHIFNGYYDSCDNKIINTMSDSELQDKFDKSKNKVFVYLATINDMKFFSNNKDTSQASDIIGNKVIRQRTAGYDLLKFAVKDKWGIDEDLSNIKVSPNGKPYTDRYKFSISHCCDLVCVAISDIDVGVDIEVVKSRQWDRLKRKILTDKEQSIVQDDNTMISLWTKKEAVFKLLDEKIFNPSKIDISKYHTDTVENILYNDDFYNLSIATHIEAVNYLVVKKMIFLQDGCCFR